MTAFVALKILLRAIDRVWHVTFCTVYHFVSKYKRDKPLRNKKNETKKNPAGGSSDECVGCGNFKLLALDWKIVLHWCNMQGPAVSHRDQPLVKNTKPAWAD